jgi:hypothetical protein
LSIPDQIADRPGDDQDYLAARTRTLAQTILVKQMLAEKSPGARMTTAERTWIMLMRRKNGEQLRV